jgi:hypothetical protein
MIIWQYNYMIILYGQNFVVIKLEQYWIVDAL